MFEDVEQHYDPHRWPRAQFTDQTRPIWEADWAATLETPGAKKVRVGKSFRGASRNIDAPHRPCKNVDIVEQIGMSMLPSQT